MSALGLLSIADSTAIAAFFAAVASIVGVVVSAHSARSTKRAEDAANRAVAATKPNGGESLEEGGTLADALVRIEARVDTIDGGTERHASLTATQLDEVNGRLRAGGERMARLEATTTATREDVAGLRSALGAEAQRRAGVEARLTDHIEDHHRTEGDHR